MSKSITSVSSLEELLKEFGVRPSDMCKVSIRRGAYLLRGQIQPSPPDDHGVLAEEHLFREHEALLQCMDTLLLLLPQVLVMNNDGLSELTKDVVCDIVDPYLHILAMTEHTADLTTNLRALWSIISLLLSNSKNVTMLGPLILQTFLNLFDELGKGRNSSPIKPNIVIVILAHSLRGADPTKMERNGLSLSDLFDGVLSLLKLADQQTCYLVGSSLLPLLFTAQNAQKLASQVWGFIVDVHRQVLCVACLGSDLILAILCCLSDIFLSYNKSSPFSSLCHVLPTGTCGPVFDLRKEDQFWEIVQEGLVSHDPFSRKRAMYLIHSVLDSVRSGGEEEVSSEERVFWWASECKQELEWVWDDLVLVLETLEEKQVCASLCSLSVGLILILFVKCVSRVSEFVFLYLSTMMVN